MEKGITNKSKENVDKRTTVEDNIKAIRLLEKIGIDTYMGIMVGFDWNKNDFKNLTKYLKTFEYPFINVQPATPLQGTTYYHEMKNLIVEDENNYHLFDMAHLVCNPTNLSRRQFYYQILKVYIKISFQKKIRTYIKRKYGIIVYKRIRKGALKIFVQYVKLILKG